MQPLPKLAAGVDPYKKINKRYLDHDERPGTLEVENLVIRGLA